MKRAKIGTYACKHGAPETARHFSKELGHKVHESTVKSIRIAYRTASKKQKGKTGKSALKSLPGKKQDVQCC